MRRRREANGRGFAMTDALVALAIAALTLTLLMTAAWGLKLASERRASLQETAPTDWLLARRTLLAWAGDATNAGPGATGAAMIGTATTLRLIVRDRNALVPYVGELRVEGSRDTGYTLAAARHDGLRDARIASDEPRRSELLTSNEPIRFVYLFPQVNGSGNTWRYETGDGDALPMAIGIEAGNQRRVTVPIFTTISQTCLAGLGPGALENSQCAVR